MIEKEFGFSSINGQEAFLKDWWTPKKLYYAKRANGKTTALLAELNRFRRNGFDCIWFSPSHERYGIARDEYYDIFGKDPSCNFDTYHNIKDALRGFKYDAVLIDELQDMDENNMQCFDMVEPLFIRASFCASSNSDLNNYSDYFESVYKNA